MVDPVKGYLSGDVVVVDDDDGVVAPDECRLRGWLKNPETLSTLESVCGHLSPERSAELSALTRWYLCLFNDVPSHTTLIEHGIDAGEAEPIQQSLYRVSEQ